jgi:hypothetical protein
MKSLPMLPCYPCPHKNNCCSRGTNLSDDEALLLIRIFGEESVVKLTLDELKSRFFDISEEFNVNTLFNSGKSEYATAIVHNKCFFLKADGSCTIYATELFPKLCDMFPWSDMIHSDRASDSHLCPEMNLY